MGRWARACTGPGGSCARRWAMSIPRLNPGRDTMDELTMVRQLLAEPAPSPQVVAEGRERLLGSAAGAGRPARRLRRPALRSVVLALGVTGAVAAAALAVATMGSGPGAPPGGGARVATGGSARTVLLAAAVKAESDSTAGRYWH